MPVVSVRQLLERCLTGMSRVPGVVTPGMLLVVIAVLISPSESIHGEELKTINLGKAGDALTVETEQESSDSQDGPPLYRSLLQPDRHRLNNDRELLGWQVSDTVFFGRTRINRENNVGVVFDLGDTTISIGHKGLFYSFVF